MAETETGVEHVEVVGETEIETSAIFDALRECYDPEIPVNIVDLGLVYNVHVAGSKVAVTMTLTAIGCPVAGEVMAEVEDRVRAVPHVEDVEVTLTFDPPWTPEKMSEDARWELGIG